MAPTSTFLSWLSRQAALAVTLGLVGLLGLTGMLGSLDRSWHDVLQRTFASRLVTPEQTALVLVDEQSLQALGGDGFEMRWPWPRQAFAALFAALHRAGAKVIVADFIFFEQAESAEQDAPLAAVGAGLPELTLGSVGDQRPVFWNEEYRQRHSPLFAGRPRWGSVQSHPDTDGVIRHYSLNGSLVAAALPQSPEVSAPGHRRLRWYGGLEQLRARGVPVLPAAPFVAAGLELLGPALEASPDFDPATLIRAIDAQPLPAGAVFDQVRGRTVFVGANAAATFDSVATPVHAPEPGVLVHWTAHGNARQQQFLRESMRGLPGLGFVLGAGVIFMAGRKGLGLRRPAGIACAVVAVTVGTSVIAFLSGLWFAPSLPTVGAAVAFSAVAVTSFRLERARKREIQGWFGAYVSPAVVSRLVADPSALKLGGERREVTLFFSDLVGFTALSEKLPAEQLVQVINLCLDELSGVLLDHGGYVDKYIGDAVMGVFGSPEPLPAHALAACRSALECQRRLEILNLRLQSEFGVTLSLRIGLNTGEAVVGNVGSARKKNYTVLGDAVNLAARLEGANKAFGTSLLIGPLTAAQVQDHLLLRPVALLRVKGKSNAVAVFEPLAERAAADDATRRFAEASTQGFDAYCSRRFAEAAAAYQVAAELRPHDVLTGSHLREARTLASEGAPPGWQPILSLDTK